jgi:hypothetical protein
MSWFGLSGISSKAIATARDDITRILEGGVATLIEQGSPEGIRDYLVKTKVVGNRVIARDCVLARYFTALLRENNIKGAIVSVGSGVTATIGVLPYAVRVRVELPRVVCGLIRGFDSGRYPELDVEHNPDLDGEIKKLLDAELANA